MNRASVENGQARAPLAWWGALACFWIAAATGALMRYWMAYGLPAGINLVNVRHAHSHLMYFGWVTPALMALILARLPALTSRRRLRWGGTVAITSVGLGLLAYLPFFLWGYGQASLGDARLPLGVIASSFNIIAWYVFAFVYAVETKGVRRSAAIRLWDAALLFMLLSSAGAWGRAVLVAADYQSPFLASAAVHLFLDLFSEGWFVLSILGLAYAWLPGEAEGPTPWANRLLFAGLPLTFLLGVPTVQTPAGLRLAAGFGGLLTASGLWLHLRWLWPRQQDDGWRVSLAFLGLKIAMLAGASLPPLAMWGEQMGLRLLYLHILLLGFVVLGVFAAARQAWGAREIAGARSISVAVSVLLLSMVPLTGLWPAALDRSWAAPLAAWLAWAPLLASLPWAFIISRAKTSRAGEPVGARGQTIATGKSALEDVK